MSFGLTIGNFTQNMLALHIEPYFKSNGKTVQNDNFFKKRYENTIRVQT